MKDILLPVAHVFALVNDDDVERAAQLAWLEEATRLAAAFMSTVTVLLAASAVANTVGTPGLQSPRNKVRVESLPAFEWSSVRGAASYEFEFSAAQNFSTPKRSTGFR